MLATADDVRKGFVLVAMFATVVLASGSAWYSSHGHDVTNYLIQVDYPFRRR
jgi:hypothetical protein